jgi:hypothetical protein
MQILLLNTKMILVMKVDRLFLGIFHSYINDFIKMFSFKSFQEPKAPIFEYKFTDGSLERDSKIILIPEFSLNVRKMVLTTNCETDKTKYIFDEIIKFLVKKLVLIDIDFLFDTYETISVVKFDFTLSGILVNPILDRLVETFKTLNSDIGKSKSINKSINALSLKYQIQYEDVGNYYKNNGLTLNDKNITIEKRMNSNIDDGIFFISSPYNYNEHMLILNTLESNSHQINT